jgi:hypothetical protein
MKAKFDLAIVLGMADDRCRENTASRRPLLRKGDVTVPEDGGGVGDRYDIRMLRDTADHPERSNVHDLSSHEHAYGQRPLGFTPNPIARHWCHHLG